MSETPGSETLWSDTSGLMTPQSNVYVGRSAGSISCEGIRTLSSSVGERLEAAHVLGHRDLGGQALHRGGAEEADDALGAVEHVLGVLGLGERAAVAQHDHVVPHPHGRVAHRL